MTKTAGFGERLLSPYKGLAPTHTTRFPRSANRWRTASPTLQLLTRNLPLGLSTRSIAHRRARLMGHEKRTGKLALDQRRPGDSLARIPASRAGILRAAGWFCVPGLPTISTKTSAISLPGSE